MKRMTVENADHFMRHIEMHTAALVKGTFTKDVSYIENLRAAQYVFLELSHDMIHIMRCKKFKGYENADFVFDVNLPSDWKHHQFRHFDYNSFRVGIRIHETLDMGIITEQNIPLTCKDAEIQMTNFSHVIQDAEVFIAMLNEHFSA